MPRREFPGVRVHLVSRLRSSSFLADAGWGLGVVGFVCGGGGRVVGDGLRPSVESPFAVMAVAVELTGKEQDDE